MKNRLGKLINLKPDLPPAIYSSAKTVVYVDPECPIFNYINTLNSHASKETATRALKAVATHTGYAGIYDICWKTIKHTDVSNLVQILLSKQLSPNTINLYVSVVKSICERAYLLDMISRREFDAILKVKGDTGSRIKKHKVITRNEFSDLLTTVQRANKVNNVKKVRDTAVFHLLIGTGLRRNELATLNMSSFEIDASNADKPVITGQFVKVIGKGNKERHVGIHPVTREALDCWLAIRGSSPGPVFVRVLRNGKFNVNPKNHLSGSAIYGLCKFYGTVAPHSLRRSYATWLDQSGTKLSRISKLLGHAKEATTAVYVIDDEKNSYNDILNNLF